MNSPSPIVSIIIVSYQCRELTLNCLRSVRAQVRTTPYEAIVVDNASTDGTLDAIAKEFPEVRMIANDSNRGFAAANNQGIAASRGEYLLLLNSDTLFIDDAVAPLVAWMNAHPDTGIAGCNVLNADRTRQVSVRSFPTPWRIFCESFFLYKLFPRIGFFADYYMTNFKYDRPRDVDWIVGAFLFVRKKAIDQCGTLNDEFFFNGEEVEFAYRLARRGWRAQFVPSGTIIHYGGGSTLPGYAALRQLHRAQRQVFRALLNGRRLEVVYLMHKLGVAARVPLYILSGLLTLRISLIQKGFHYLRLLPIE